MKLVLISDTHGKHQGLDLPKGDMLIHAGDVSEVGDLDEIVDFLDWFGKQEFKYKVFIAGNHDFYFESISKATLDDIIPEGVIYLNDSGIELEGLKIWGSPVQPFFFNLAFNRQRGDDIKKHWDLIPKDTDILITHGPPYGVLDKTSSGEIVGCEDLADAIKGLKLKVHVFGHIHESYGSLKTDRLLYVNASVLNLRYNLVNPAFLIEI